MPPLEIQIDNTCQQANYSHFINNHTQPLYMHSIQTIGVQHFMG